MKNTFQVNIWPISWLNDTATQKRFLWGEKIQTNSLGCIPPHPTKACTLCARLEHRSVFTLDPRLKVSSYFFQGVNFKFSHTPKSIAFRHIRVLAISNYYLSSQFIICLHQFTALYALYCNAAHFYDNLCGQVLLPPSSLNTLTLSTVNRFFLPAVFIHFLWYWRGDFA